MLLASAGRRPGCRWTPYSMQNYRVHQHASVPHGRASAGRASGCAECSGLSPGAGTADWGSGMGGLPLHHTQVINPSKALTCPVASILQDLDSLVSTR